MFALVTFSFVEIMLDPGTRANHGGHGALATVIVLFALFSGGSVAFAGYFARKKRKQAKAEAPDEPLRDRPEASDEPPPEPPAAPEALVSERSQEKAPPTADSDD